MLGFRAPGAAARTGDVDIGQFPAISIAVEDRIEPDLLSVLNSVDPAFEAVQSPFDPSRTLRYAIRSGSVERFVVDVLAPMRGPPRDRPVHPPTLEGDARPLRFLDFLLYREIVALVLHGTGIPVKVPAPERFERLNAAAALALGRSDGSVVTSPPKSLQPFTFRHHLVGHDPDCRVSTRRCHVRAAAPRAKCCWHVSAATPRTLRRCRVVWAFQRLKWRTG